MAKYKKCPRCELNYIPIEKEYCALCEQELKGHLIVETDEEDEEEGLCPRCRTNYLNDGEKYCEQCQAEIDAEKEKSAHADFWEEEADDTVGDDDMFIDDMLDDGDIASLGALEDEEFDEDYDDEEEVEQDYFEDDFESVSVDDYDPDEEEEEEDEEDPDEF